MHRYFIMGVGVSMHVLCSIIIYIIYYIAQYNYIYHMWEKGEHRVLVSNIERPQYPSILPTSFNTRTKEQMLTNWKAFLLSHLVYCFPLRPLCSAKLPAEFEAFQCQYSKTIEAVLCTSNGDWLRNQFYSLQRRRESYAIIYSWKILEGPVPNLGIKFYQKCQNWPLFYCNKCTIFSIRMRHEVL